MRFTYAKIKQLFVGQTCAKILIDICFHWIETILSFPNSFTYTFPKYFKKMVFYFFFKVFTFSITEWRWSRAASGCFFSVGVGCTTLVAFLSFNVKYGKEGSMVKSRNRIFHTLPIPIGPICLRQHKK